MATAAFIIGGAPGPQVIDQTSLLELHARIDAKSSVGKRQYFVIILENQIFFTLILEQRHHLKMCAKANERGKPFLSRYVSKLTK